MGKIGKRHKAFHGAEKAPGTKEVDIGGGETKWRGRNGQTYRKEMEYMVNPDGSQGKVLGQFVGRDWREVPKGKRFIKDETGEMTGRKGATAYDFKITGASEFADPEREKKFQRARVRAYYKDYHDPDDEKNKDDRRYMPSEKLGRRYMEGEDIEDAKEIKKRMDTDKAIDEDNKRRDEQKRIREDFGKRMPKNGPKGSGSEDEEFFKPKYGAPILPEPKRRIKADSKTWGVNRQQASEEEDQEEEEKDPRTIKNRRGRALMEK